MLTSAGLDFTIGGILRLTGSPEELTGQAVGGGSRYTFWLLPFIMSTTYKIQKNIIWEQEIRFISIFQKY